MYLLMTSGYGGFDDHHHSRHKRQLEHHMENLTGGTPPVSYLPCVVPCKLYFLIYKKTAVYSHYSLSLFCIFKTTYMLTLESVDQALLFTTCRSSRDFRHSMSFASQMSVPVCKPPSVSKLTPVCFHPVPAARLSFLVKPSTY